jgi:heat shock protein HtpX
MNGLKTVFLLGLMSSILLFGGRMIAGEQGLYFGLVMAIGMNFFSYFFSEKLALRMSGALPLSPTENADIYYRVAPMTERLAQRMGIPMPKLWVTPEESPNAFATGRNPNNASVAVTVGLVRLMNDAELEGVIAHELGHIKNRDILISSIAATIASAISFLGQMAFFFGGRRGDDEEAPNPLVAMLMFLLAPIAAMIIQMAISRTREFSADATAAKYTGSPWGLISALRKLESYAHRIPMEASPATAHMYIMKPLGGGGMMMRLFSTHPSTADRIAALERFAG